MGLPKFPHFLAANEPLELTSVREFELGSFLVDMLLLENLIGLQMDLELPFRIERVNVVIIYPVIEIGVLLDRCSFY